MPVTFKDDRRAWDKMLKDVLANEVDTVKYGFIAGSKASDDHKAPEVQATPIASATATGGATKPTQAQGQTSGGGSGISIVALAAAHEFGVPGHLEERSFIRATWDEKIGSWTEMLVKLTGMLFDGTMKKAKALGLAGQRAVADTKNFIRERNVTPGDSTATILRKGSDVALVDSGQLINSITYQVQKGD